MPTFTPPVSVYPNESGDWFIDMIDQNHGLTIISKDGGATFELAGEYPYLGDLSWVDAITSEVGSPGVAAQEGVTFFLGGHVYEIDDVLGQRLYDAGFFPAFPQLSGLPGSGFFPSNTSYPHGA